MTSKPTNLLKQFKEAKASLDTSSKAVIKEHGELLASIGTAVNQ